MKNIVASVGMVALSAASVQAAADFMADAGKPWSVSATLRGFYDDNTDTLPDHKESRWGYEISPSVNLNWRNDQNSLKLGYVYSFKYYDKAPIGQSEKYDQTHEFDAIFDHTFNERFRLDVRDSFVVGQEPDLLRAGNTISTPERIPGDNIRNYGNIGFNAQLTPILGVFASYANSYYDYHASGIGVPRDGAGNPVVGSAIVPSPSATQDRVEHYATVEGRYEIQRTTVGILGYMYGQTLYTGDEPISGTVLDTGNPADVGDPNLHFSKERDSRSHYVYIGVEETFNPTLFASLRAGAQFIDHYNDSNAGSDVAPYGNASLRWTYLPGSSLEGGFTISRVSTDLVGTGVDKNGNEVGLTTDQQVETVYATVNHKITPKLVGSLIGQFQYGTFQGGVNDGESERVYLVGLNLEYQFNPRFSTHVGYNYDRLDSDAGRSYDRNRVYIGATVTY